jgi:hypothetical protein
MRYSLKEGKMARLLIDITEATRAKIDKIRAQKKISLKRLVLNALGLKDAK